MIDTWAWLAFGHRRDARHDEVRRIFEAYEADKLPLCTTDYVLDELISLLYRRENFEEATRFVDGIFANAAKGKLQIQRVTTSRFQAALGLRRRFRDKPAISFTDFTTMAIMQELEIIQVMTGDEHFSHIGMGFQKVP